MCAQSPVSLRSSRAGAGSEMLSERVLRASSRLYSSPRSSHTGESLNASKSSPSDTYTRRSNDCFGAHALLSGTDAAETAPAGRGTSTLPGTGSAISTSVLAACCPPFLGPRTWLITTYRITMRMIELKVLPAPPSLLAPSPSAIPPPHAARPTPRRPRPGASRIDIDTIGCGGLSFFRASLARLSTPHKYQRSSWLPTATATAAGCGTDTLSE